MSNEKAIQKQLGGEVQGQRIESDESGNTWMSLVPCKMARLMSGEWALLGMARPTVAALERVVGKSEHIILPQRHTMCILEIIFSQGANARPES